MRVSRSLAALALPIALIAGGCSSNDDNSDTAKSGDSSAETTTTAAAATGSTGSTGADANPADTATESIVQIALGNSNFSTLVSLVKAAGLVEPLSGDGPFTVFAPTDAAFGAVDPATLSALAADPTGKLADVLKLHVVAGQIRTEDIPPGGMTVDTLNGGKLRIEVVGEKQWKVGGVNVIVPNVQATNGVIHAVDGVITAPNG